MELGVFPIPWEAVENDPIALRDFAQAVEAIGYKQISLLDHVVNMPKRTSESGRWAEYQGSYTHEMPAHEPLITIGFLAAVTERLEFNTNILILPQRQAVLFAKQLAELDVLSGERVTIALGVGYQPWEFEALGVDWLKKGPIIEEQIEVCRLLWSQPLVTFKGRFHTLDNVGINPRPARGFVPLWMGGGNPRLADGREAPQFERVLRRIGRLCDGWNVHSDGIDDYLRAREIIYAAAREAGRDPEQIAMYQQGSRIDDRNIDVQVAHIQRWEEAGITHVGIGTQARAFKGLDEHIDAFRRFYEAYPS